MRRLLVIWLAGMGLYAVLWSNAHAAGDAAAGKAKAETCMGCHAIPTLNNAYPTYHVPMVGGQHADYLVAALKAYQNGERTHATMQAQAATLSDADMADIAAFFSGQ